MEGNKIGDRGRKEGLKKKKRKRIRVETTGGKKGESLGIAIDVIFGQKKMTKGKSTPREDKQE